MTRLAPPLGRRRGSVLILVLWMVIVLGVVGLSYTAAVQTQLMTSRMMRGRHTAAWAARAGVERAMAELTQVDLREITDTDPLMDGGENRKDQPVGEDASYTLIGQADAEGNPRYGLVDECSRISINRASENLLLNLNGMSKEMAESLIDWRDGNSEALAEGAEDDYYESLSSPYPAKNAAFDSVRELLRVKGWGPVFELAWPDPYRRFATGAPAPEPLATPGTSTGTSAPGSNMSPAADTGADTNFADTADMTASASGEATADDTAMEDAAAGSFVNADGMEVDAATARTLLGCLTAWSGGPQANPDGEEQVNMTEADANEMRRAVPGLTQEEAEDIVVWQKNKGFKSPADLVNVTQPTTDQLKQAGFSARSSSSGTPSSGNEKSFTLERVGEIVDYFTTKPASPAPGAMGGEGAKVLTGRININTAPREVLLAIPGMSEEVAEQIISQRTGEGAIARPGDLTRYNGLSGDDFRKIYPWICTESTRFHVTSQGRDRDSGATVTVEAVLAYDDQKEITVVYWREF